MPEMATGYEVMVKKGNEYVAIDSICILNLLPVFPAEGEQIVDLKSGSQLEFSFVFPAACPFSLYGDLKIRYTFPYYLDKKLVPRLTKTEWYYYHNKKE